MKILNTIKRNTLPALIAISAISVSMSAAFYSVTGLGKLFAGATHEVMIMAGSLEIAKLVVASLLYQYWTRLNKFLRVYLSIATVVLVLITSMGIYGFLSAAFQTTNSQLAVSENKISYLQQKVDYYTLDVNRHDSQLDRISDNISTLSSTTATTIQVRDTSSSTGFRNTVSTSGLRISQKRIDVEEKNRIEVQKKRTTSADSLQKYQLQILSLANSTETAGELGPLKYITELTGYPMNKIINWLILVIVFVFDPLAISLVIAANFAFEEAKEKKEEPLEEEILEEEPPLEKELLLEEEIVPEKELIVEEEPPVEVLEEERPTRATSSQTFPDKVEETVHVEQNEKPIDRVLLVSPTRLRVRFTDGTEGWVDRKRKDLNTLKKRYF